MLKKDDLMKSACVMTCSVIFVLWWCHSFLWAQFVPLHGFCPFQFANLLLDPFSTIQSLICYGPFTYHFLKSRISCQTCAGLGSELAHLCDPVFTFKRLSECMSHGTGSLLLMCKTVITVIASTLIRKPYHSQNPIKVLPHFVPNITWWS